MARRYAVDTDDDGGRLVAHRPILAGGTGAAVKTALRRRYRLPKGARVELKFSLGHAELNPNYARGWYRVFWEPFAEQPAFSGSFYAAERD